MAPAAGKKAAAQKKAKADKPTVKHVQLGLTSINGTQKPLRQASLAKFSVSLPSPSSSQERRTTSPVIPVKPNLSGKGKGKEKASVIDYQNSQSWIDKYAPTSLEELAVHKRKVQDVQRWLEEATTGGPTGVLKKYRRLLALTGPAGAGKTATIRMLAKEMNIEITEWQNALGVSNDEELPESLSQQFTTFLRGATGVLSFGPSSSALTRPRIILLEDLPNVLHVGTRDAFQDAVETLVATPGAPPLVIIISESGLRGMGSEGWRREERWDVRHILGPRLLQNPAVTEIQFNPVAPTIMHAALSRILARTHPTSAHLRPSPEALDMIAESSMGDIRSAINALQFACRSQIAESVKGGAVVKRKRGKKGQVGEEVRRIIESITRNEHMLVLFHVLGRVMYNKRFGDDPEENEDPVAEANNRGTLSLAPHLSQFERRPSKVDISALYADTPIDMSLLPTYCHQNYPQFCTEVEHLESAAEWISYSEAFSWDAELNNIRLPEHAFHMMTGGLLMSLPTPVPRRGQKLLKSPYWEFNRKERDNIEALRSWSQHDIRAAQDHRSIDILERAWAGRKVGKRQPGEVSDIASMYFMPPVRGGHGQQQLLEEDEVPDEEPEVSMSQKYEAEVSDIELGGNGQDAVGWLEEDDIEGSD